MPTSARTPQIVAHRGSSRDEPEHTLEAYLRAIDEGADALECDVRLTADGHLVCVHDRRVDRTSNGVGRVSTLELGDPRGPRLGVLEGRPRRLEDEMPDRDRDRNKLLTLRHLLTTVVDDDRPIELAIETKHPTRYAGLVERRLVELLDEFGCAARRRRRPGAGHVLLPALAAADAPAGPGLPLVLLFERVPAIVRFRDGTLPRGVRIAARHRRSCAPTRGTSSAPPRARAPGARLDRRRRPTTSTCCLELGVDAIITNRPGFVRDHAGLRPRRRPLQRLTSPWWQMSHCPPR